MFCPQCGVESTTDLKFCRSCGANLKVIGKAVSLSEAIARSDSVPAKIKDMVKNLKLEKVTDEVCALMKPAASKRNIMINIEASSNHDVVTLDQRKFKQVLYNLLSNAVNEAELRRYVDGTDLDPAGVDLVYLFVMFPFPADCDVNTSRWPRCVPRVLPP